MTRKGTYVFCVVAATKRPRLRDVPRGLPGMGSVRLLDIGRDLYAIAADVPLSRYNETALNRGLTNLDWVSRAAVAHEAIIEHFINAPAVLPMKLFTIFGSDERSLEHVRSERPRIDALVRRVAGHHEWGVRVSLDRGRALAAARNRAVSETQAKRRHGAAGVAYLAQKKAQRDFSRDLASRARETVTALYDELAAKARLARRRATSELRAPSGSVPAQGGSLLLDAAFLVPRARAESFRSLTARRARALARQGYAVRLTGPWPPYTFVQD